MKYLSNSISETEKIASLIFNDYFKKYNLILIDGSIGSGKSVMVRKFASLLGIKDRITSPTYGIKSSYNGLIHYDLYLSESKIDSNEFLSMVLEETQNNKVIIEWSQNLNKKMFDNYLLIKIEVLKNEKRNIYVEEI